MSVPEKRIVKEYASMSANDEETDDESDIEESDDDKVYFSVDAKYNYDLIKEYNNELYICKTIDHDVIINHTRES